MKTKIALLAAATFCVPAVFAQTAVQSGTGATVSSGTGVVVTPGAPGAAVAVPTHTVGVMPSATVSGGVVAQAGTTESVNGNTRTVVTRYWVNVPAGVERDAEFQRWQRLR